MRNPGYTVLDTHVQALAIWISLFVMSSDLLQTHAFLALPSEILEGIFEYLTKEEMIMITTISRRFRERLLPFVMEEIKASWNQLIEIQDSGALKEFRHRNDVHQLRITDSNSYNEYQMNTFSSLLSPSIFPALSRVLVNSSNSSYWLKYNESVHITHLTLYSDDDIKSTKTFNLAHVNNFRNLRSLSLQNYHFNWTDEEELKIPHVPLSELSLRDCTWEYPFNLTSFNRSNLLACLTIDYSQNNPFTLSERFESFLKDPLPVHSESLKVLSISFLDYTQNIRFLSPRILAQFMSRFTNLESLCFEGWAANLNSLRTFLSSVRRESSLTLSLRLGAAEDDVRDRFPQVPGSNVHVKWH